MCTRLDIPNRQQRPSYRFPRQLALECHSLSNETAAKCMQSTYVYVRNEERGRERKREGGRGGRERDPMQRYMYMYT